MLYIVTLCEPQRCNNTFVSRDISLDNPIQIRDTRPRNTMQLMQQLIADHAAYEASLVTHLSRTTQLTLTMAAHPEGPMRGALVGSSIITHLMGLTLETNCSTNRLNRASRGSGSWGPSLQT